MTKNTQQNNKINMTYGTFKSYRTNMTCIVLFVLLCSFFITPQKIAHAGILSRPPTNLGLVGYWPMDEGVGDKVFDMSNQNNTGVITSATWTNGKHSKALSFGSGKYVNAGTSNSLNMTSDFTSSVWFKTSGQGLNSWGALMGRGTASYFINNPNKGWFLVSRNISGTNYINFQYSGALANQQVSWTGGSDNLWHHAIVMRSGDLFSLYIDGVLKNSLTTAVGDISTPSETFFIGKGRTTDYFIGSLDDVRIYNRALTAAEISKLYSSGGARAKSGPKLVQTTSCDISSNACTVNLSLTPGNFIFIAQSGSSTNGPYSASDTLGNVYLTANPYNTDPQFTGNNDNQTLYSANIKGGSATITCTRTSNGGGSRCLIMEFSGIALLNPLDAHAENRNTSTALNSGSIVTRYPGELLIGFFADTGGTYTAGSQYQLPFGSARSLEYKISSASGSYSATATHSNSNTAWGSIAAFKTAFQPTKINSSQNNKLTNGLVGMWSFNGADMNWASGIAYDSSGQGNNGTLTNMSATTSPAAGKVGQALKFDKVDDFVDVGSPAMYDNLPTLSYCAWVKPNTFGEIFIGMIFAKGFSKYFGITGSNKLNFTVQYDGADLNKTTTSDMVYGVWSHVCATWAGGPDASSVKLYVNGISVATTDSSATGTVLLEQTEPYAIGNVDGATRTFDGAIDEVRLYNRALSTDEVKQLYNMGK